MNEKNNPKTLGQFLDSLLTEAAPVIERSSEMVDRLMEKGDERFKRERERLLERKRQFDQRAAGKWPRK